ncbi:hypothetical protein HQ545_07140 [Candidatus Woesearchaeota archaeon]|nr:hypothetical protein [Candidatus Woesearchaeota archaeon]
MSDEEFWTDDLVEDEDEPLEEIDSSKLKFTKIKDLELGMENVNIEATIDFVGDVMGKGYGEDPFAISFLKDSSGEVKMTIWGDNLKKAKKGQKIQVFMASVGEYRGELQLYPDRRRGVEFV